MEEEPKGDIPEAIENNDIPPADQKEMIFMHIQRMFSVTPLDNIYGGIHFM